MKMKRLYIIIFALIAGHYCAAQQSGQNDWTISFNNYFESDSTSETSVNLYAKPYYSNTSWQSKSFVIDNILSMRNKKVAYVSYGHKREIWGKDATQTVRLLDTLDMNSNNLKGIERESQKLIKHPWFFYFGGQSNFNSETFSLMLSARIGFFLLKDRWDLALSETFSVSETGATSELGILSKVYYPIKKYKISPYIGTGLSLVYTGYDNGQEYTENTYWAPTLLWGISWYVGHGSLDVGMQYGKTSKFAVTVGYTFLF
jgi:hypothetical protein